MATRRVTDTKPKPARRRATTPEARENELIGLATDLAETQLRDGTASAQVISLYLKLGSSREKLEQERLEYENALLQAKREFMESQQNMEALYAAALGAMSAYKGETPTDMHDEYDG